MNSTPFTSGQVGLRVDLEASGVDPTLAQRIARRVVVLGPDDCWAWLWKDGNQRPGRYGIIGIRVDGRHTTTPSHRFIYSRLVGDPGSGDVDHRCRNEACNNPAHLEAVTHRENIRRGASRDLKVQTHCKRGHEFNEANTYQYINARGNPARMCRPCCNLRRKLS